MKLTRADIIKYLTLIQAEFPSRELDAESMRLRCDLWYCTLGEYSKEEVEKAFYEAITNCEFAPKIKNVADICKRNRNPYAVTPQDLWNEILGVLPQVEEAAIEIKLGNYRAWDERIQDYGKLSHYVKGRRELDAIFQKLRPETKRYFGNNPGQLTVLCEMTDEAREFEKARFLKAVQPFIEQQETADKTGADGFYELISGTTKAITDKSEGGQ